MVLNDYGLVTLATLGLTLAAIYVALYIAYQAYRGLRRHDSKPMRYLSVGILLLFGVTYTVSFAGTIAFRYSVVSLDLQPAFRFLVRLLQLGGLGAVAYSLYLVRTQEPTLTATADGGLAEIDRTSVPAGTSTDESPADASTDQSPAGASIEESPAGASTEESSGDASSDDATGRE